MLLASGPIEEKTKTLGMVWGYGSSTEAGCSSTIDGLEAYKNATEAIKEQARSMGADGIVSVSYEYRNATSKACAGSGKQVFEVYAWGTAVQLQS
jgi:uncharacterized protein YbjQ (UPF0145 family)